MFTQGFITVVHNDPAAPWDHCGICRIRPQDFCLKVWCPITMSHHISVYYKTLMPIAGSLPSCFLLARHPSISWTMSSGRLKGLCHEKVNAIKWTI